jgi:hypothetical protein
MREVAMGIWSTVLVGVVLTASAAPTHGVDVAAWHTARANPPNVVGLSYTDAVATLQAWQPLVKIVVLPTGIPAGADPTLMTVDSERGDETSVYVSLVTEMPDVVGMTIDQAAPTLAARGIVWVLNPVGASGDAVVDSQAPDAGTTVRIEGNSGPGTSDGGGGSSDGGGTHDGLPTSVVTLHVAAVVQPSAPPQSPSVGGHFGGGPGSTVTDGGGARKAGEPTTDGSSPWTAVAVSGGAALCVLVLIVLAIVVALSVGKRRQPLPAQPAFPPAATRFPPAQPAPQPRRMARLTTRVQWPPSSPSVQETGATSGHTLTVRLHADPSQPTIEEVP